MTPKVGSHRSDQCTGAERSSAGPTTFVSPVPDEPSPPLEGEHLETTHWEDAHHWISIYSDLLEFKRGILDQIRRDLAKLPPDAQKAAESDLKIVESQMIGYQQRLDLWSQRVRELHGLWLDPDRRLIRYKNEEATLTVREFQLLQFLLNHPQRYFTVAEILSQAWGGPALFPEEVRTYVRRIRKILAAMEIPCDVVNRPGRGYSLTFRGGL